MFDWFLILTPLLILAVVALFAFMGCNPVLGLHDTKLGISVDQLVPNTGPRVGGTQVRIFGSNFTGADQVTFGTINAPSFSVMSDKEIDVVSPPSPTVGEVDVSVSRSSDSDGTLVPQPFQYVALGFVQTQSTSKATSPPLSVSLSNTMAGNLLIAAVAYGGPPAGSVSVSDNLGNGFALAGNSPWYRQSRIFFLPNIPGGNVTITATGAGGAAGPCAMCVSEYSGADPTSAAVYGFSTKASLSAGTAGLENVQGITVTLAQAGDFAYVVIFAAQSTQITAAAGLTPHPSSTTSVLVEDASTSFAATQSVATIDSTGGGFVPWVALAIGIKS